MKRRKTNEEPDRSCLPETNGEKLVVQVLADERASENG